MRNLLMSAVLVGASLLGSTAFAQELIEGRNYVALSSPAATAQPEKIEVIELFWYGCPHCYQLEATINPWSKKLPEDVNFIRVPAMFGGIWNVHGQLFLTLETMQAESKVHDSIFNALHNAGRKLSSLDEIANFVAEQGVDKALFLKTWNSFSVKSQMEKAKKQAITYQISGVPAIVINGKYRFDIGMAGGLQETVEVADALIEKERQAK
ncbi:MAG: thiol:disulfide interchange protein DsbA/DsbL [Pseudomonas sp.]|jgi:thiol:disulfide interchange protein DsbA|nr:thiol:disulfide interchange protein DsbA/DsbL [Pseudomonas sp.]MDD2223374.1 thiol:disulfide interchange protein DsbA/DsbL [Pseudomonas sp.]MDY0414810.1 thiol:disulfide interchange protein DsbA/DsbL [Pseudomonas sp.]NLO53503.1 thiol:disulfide interchange protein DsbA/DsbL [Gammaproteobacteria bacterium]